MWDTTTGQDRLTLAGHTDWVRGIAYSPGGARIATVSFDGTARVWDAATGDLLATIQGGGRLQGIAFGPDGSQLASGVGQVAKVWKAESGQKQLTLADHTKLVWAIAFAPMVLASRRPVSTTR